MSLYWTETKLSSTRIELVSTLSRQGPVVCRVCGCRLVAEERLHADGESTGAWRHFEGQPGRDARGCKIDCADLTHLADGTPVS
jgi:hypothetical protein